jgi:hypothetical protein
MPDSIPKWYTIKKIPVKAFSLIPWHVADKDGRDLEKACRGIPPFAGCPYKHIGIARSPLFPVPA